MRMFLKLVALSTAMMTTVHAGENLSEDIIGFKAQADAFSQAAFIKQIGNNNETNVNQSGAENIAIAVVKGNNNRLDLKQSGFLGANSMELSQAGNDNAALIRQSVFLSSGNSIQALQKGSSNRMTAFQVGIFSAYANEIELSQKGRDNSALFIQLGGDNVIDAQQAGHNNSAIYTQFGYNNDIQSSQTGNNLNSFITQYGNATMTITQTGF